MNMEQQLKAALEGKVYFFTEDMQVKERPARGNELDNYRPDFRTTAELIRIRRLAHRTPAERMAQNIKAATALLERQAVKSPKAVIALVAAYHGMTVEEICAANNRKIYAKPRFIACWLLFKRFGMAKTAIGRRMNRHPATILEAIRVVDRCPARYEPELSRIAAEIDRITNSKRETS